MAKIGPKFGQNACYEILNKIRKYGPIFKRPMSTGPSGPGLSKKILAHKILQYTAEKMRKNREKRPKNAKIVSDGRTLTCTTNFVCAGVSLLEVDSEPLGPGLDARRFSFNSDNVAFCGFFEKLKIFTFQKSVFQKIRKRQRCPIFKKIFLGERPCQDASLKPLCTQILCTVWPLHKIQFLKLKNDHLLIVKIEFPKSVGGF